MSYLYIGMIISFLVALIVIAKVMDGDDMKKEEDER
jgi:hypothetical protein